MTVQTCDTVLVVSETARPGAEWTTTAYELEEVVGQPDVVLIDASVERRNFAGCRAARRWPEAKLLFMVPEPDLERFRSGLPFAPALAGAVALSEQATRAQLDVVLAELLDAARHAQKVSGVHARLNSELQQIGASKAAAHRKHHHLAMAERYLASVLEFSPLGLLALDLSGRVVSSNEAGHRLLGQEALASNAHLATTFPEEHRVEVRRALDQAVSGENASCGVTAPASATVMDLSAAPIRGQDGEVIGVSVSLSDVSQHKRLEQELAEANRRLSAVLDNASVSIFLMNEKQQCVYMNSAAEALTGYALTEALDRPLHDVIHHTRPDGTPYLLEDCPIDRAFPENHNEQGEEVFVHKDGSFFPVAFTASPIRDEASRTVGTIVEVRDISAEKRAEAARQLLMREVDHRSRNVLAVAHSIVELTRASDLDAFKSTVAGRIQALARAQGSLADAAWEGASLSQLLEDTISAIGRPDAFVMEGPPVILAPNQVQPLSMIVHEMTTNARKYGAFSTDLGRIRVRWQVTQDQLLLAWDESGLENITTPVRRGFGSRLITDLAKQLKGSVESEWRRSGLLVSLTIPR